MATYYVTTAGDNGNAGTSEGAAWADPGYAASQITTDGDIVYVKSGTYTLSTSTPGAGGPVVLPTNINCRMEGYLSTIGDRAARPVIDAGAVTGVTLFGFANTNSGDMGRAVSMAVDGQGNATVYGFAPTTASAIMRNGCIDCVAIDCVTGFGNATLGVRAVNSRASGCTTGFIALGGANTHATSWCASIDCTTGYSLVGDQASVQMCLAHGGTVGFGGSASRKELVSCIADGCSDDGFQFGQTDWATYCIATFCGAYGFDNSSVDALIYGCYGYSNTSGNVRNTPTMDAVTALSGDPWTNRAGDVFNINSTAGAGAVLRAYSITKGNSVWYPFRQWVVDDFGGGGGGGFYRRVPVTIGAGR